jgi:integrase
MCEQFIYKSVFAPYFIAFLEMKCTMGYDLTKYKWIFLEFDRFFVEACTTDAYITSKQISAWHATRVNDKSKTLYDKYSLLRQFCKYLCHLGKDSYIPRLPKNAPSNFVPYIFSHQQIESIFNACDQLTMQNRNMNCTLFALPALFRFLYSTGVRIGEALSIRNEDVDFERQRIILGKTKNRKQRLIPINASLFVVLKQYEAYRNKMPVQKVSASDSFFFVSSTGKHMSKCTVLVWFKKILKECGIPYLGNHHGPRVHDIRHTCAVHSLMKMVGNGIDIYCALPILSIFLGHKSLKGTERYVRLTQEMYPEILKMEQSISSFVFPKTNLQIKIDDGNN